MNYKNLIQKGFFTTNPKAVITNEYLEYKDKNGVRWAFIGESFDGKPAGIVRAISMSGSLYEGMMNAEGHTGWGVRYEDGSELIISFWNDNGPIGKYYVCEKRENEAWYV